MSRTRIVVFVSLILSLVIAPALPAASAHQDGCTLTLHEGSLQTHQACTSSPNTCLSNVRALGVDLNVVCKDPHTHPCLLALTVLEETYRVGCA